METNAVVCLVKPCQECKSSATNFRCLEFPPNRIPSLAQIPSAAAVPLGSGSAFQPYTSQLTCQDVLIIYRK
jgi:hypothetical protein